MANSTGKKEDKVVNKILQTAKKLFAEEGFHKTDRTKIRRLAHAGEVTISTRFDDEELVPKEMILVKILETEWRDINQLIENLDDTVDVMERLRRILSIVLDVFEKDRNLRIITIAHSRELYALGRRIMEGEARKVVTRVESIFFEGQNKGAFRKDLSSKSMQRAFFGVIEEFLHSWVLNETIGYQTEISRRELEKTIDSILLGFKVSEESPEDVLRIVSRSKVK